MEEKRIDIDIREYDGQPAELTVPESNLDEPVDLKCEACSKTLHFDIGVKWWDAPEIEGWCRFQFGQDAGKPVLWFCCAEDLIGWLRRPRKH